MSEFHMESDALGQVLEEFTEDADLRYERGGRMRPRWPRTVRCHRIGCDGTNTITFDDFITSSWKVEACSLECHRHMERLRAQHDAAEAERWELANLRR